MKRPWNIIDSQVYSLVTYKNHKLNMNLVTYVTPVSRNPKIYAISIYHNTKTIENLQANGKAILQFLTTDHLKIARTLGKRSGTNFDKDAYLRKRNLIIDWKELEVLKGCAAYVSLNVHSFQTTGDHDLFLFHVESFETKTGYNDLLMSNHLRNAKIINV